MSTVTSVEVETLLVGRGLTSSASAQHPGRVGLRVVFAEDNFLVREGTAALLTEATDLELVALVGDSDALLAAVEEQRPDAVLTDIRMPPTWTDEGIEAARRIRREHPEVGVMVLSQYVETGTPPNCWRTARAASAIC